MVEQRKYRVVFQPDGRQGTVEAGQTVLEVARALGVYIESICGGRQTCGKCRVRVVDGRFDKYGIHSAESHLSPPDAGERACATRCGLAPGERLGCSARILGDVVIEVPEASREKRQVIRKEVGERELRVNPAMRLYYVELPEPALEESRGEWERVQEELESHFGLTEVRPDATVLRALQQALREGRRGITLTLWHDREAVRVQPGYHEDLYGMAIDVGTTTVAGHLVHLRTGEVLATVSIMNPQVTYGEDIMSRIAYAMRHADGRERLHRAILDGLNDLIRQAAAEAGISPRDIVEVVLVGNTVMHHLFLGLDPTTLGTAPFTLALQDAVDVKARDFGLDIAPGGNVHVLPCEAGHVGADNVAVLLAEAPHRVEGELHLIIDVGTNGEILLGNREGVLAASSPTGPAFEGAQIRHGMRAAPGAIERVRIDPETLEVRFKVIGEERWNDAWPEDALDAFDVAARGRRGREKPTVVKARGICGSGIIEAVAELWRVGALDDSGRFVPGLAQETSRFVPEGEKGAFILAWPHETATGQPIVVHSDDVRAVQLAKAALYTGAKLLMKRLGVSQVDRIKLAGGFGSYISPTHALMLGMIPDAPLEQVEAVGNAAGDGALMALLDKDLREEARRLARWVTYVGTALEADFQEEFVAALHLPHRHDPFPHLKPLLAEAEPWRTRRRARVQEANARRRRRRRASRHVSRES